MRLFQLGDRIVNLDAVAHIHYAHNPEQDYHYCQVFFTNASPLTLKGELAIHFWAVARHLSIDITSKREPQTTAIAQ